MTVDYEQMMGQPYPLGVNRVADGINVSIPICCRRECGMIVSVPHRNSIKIAFDSAFQTGSLYTVLLKGAWPEEFVYQIYADDQIIPDPYAKAVNGRKKWGSYHAGKRQLSYTLKKDTFDWEGDTCLQIPFHESIFYGLHIRGFTKHPSSKVRAKGTFEGVIEKIPYLRELGITAVVCMPFYDFDEILLNPEYRAVQDSIKIFLDKEKATWEYKINYWGFSEAQYFAPKASFAYSDDPSEECRRMIRQLHKNGIECIMRIYFGEKTPATFIYEVLKYWVIHYHVDGFHLMGSHLPVDMLGNDPLLGRTKIMAEHIPAEHIYREPGRGDCFKNLALLNDEFMIQARRFLKGDEDMLYKVAMQFRSNPAQYAQINYMTSYQGFTLMDLVSYDRKHNEANGEENRDGAEYNFSWNCGAEGKTKKKAVQKLRLSQIKNALIMIFLSQGVPMLQAGDEFGFSEGGNNNPYCQDNAVTWLNWNLVHTNDEIFGFVKKLIEIRKGHPILHKEEELHIMDYISCGYPDLSYHGEDAWRPQFQNYNRHLGVLYCGQYAKIDRNTDDDFFYIMYNMHWLEHEFALPKLPKGGEWSALLGTWQSEPDQPAWSLKPDEKNKITIPPRSICVMIGKVCGQTMNGKKGEIGGWGEDDSKIEE